MGKDGMDIAAGVLSAGMIQPKDKMVGESAKELAAKAKRKKDKLATVRRAAIDRNETIFSKNGEPDAPVMGQANIFNKKTLG